MLLLPFHLVIYCLVYLRQLAYRVNLLKSTKINVPVIIVGNITLGGTGKSPVVIHLAERLSASGYKIGVLSRGYGGASSNYPLEVTRNSLPDEVGDEPLMIKNRLDASVVVDPIRARGANYLVEHCASDLIICDDGLQHYALQRDMEILVLDETRGVGNGLLIPFGPLRESVGRLKSVDAIVLNGSINKSLDKNTFALTIKSDCFVSVKDSNKHLDVEQFKQMIHAKQLDMVAAIGNPKRFFDQLGELGLAGRQHQYIDHHTFISDDFKAMNSIIIMTEKDAVKCAAFATEDMWYLKVDGQIQPSLVDYCLSLLEKKGA